MGRSNTGRRCLLVIRVSGRSRVPRPPASTTPFTETLPPLSAPRAVPEMPGPVAQGAARINPPAERVVGQFESAPVILRDRAFHRSGDGCSPLLGVLPPALAQFSHSRRYEVRLRFSRQDRNPDDTLPIRLRLVYSVSVVHEAPARTSRRQPFTLRRSHPGKALP